MNATKITITRANLNIENEELKNLKSNLLANYKPFSSNSTHNLKCNSKQVILQWNQHNA